MSVVKRRAVMYLRGSTLTSVMRPGVLVLAAAGRLLTHSVLSLSAGWYVITKSRWLNR